MNHLPRSVPLLLLAALLLGLLAVPPLPADRGADPGSTPERPPAARVDGMQRTPWTSSRVTGTPEPPPPYRTARVFPNLRFKNPLLLVRAPDLKRFVVGEQAGKLFSFPYERNSARADLFLDLTTELTSWDRSGPVKGVEAVYGLAFHPRFAQNRYCYVCYVLAGKKGNEPLADGTRVSRFRVTDTNPPRCDPASEKVLITWLAGGHNGGDLHFGPDGFLYISTGDATSPNPPDALDTGQDLGDLLASILRIDVDREDKGKPYAVPPDNPFLRTAGARPEIWAYGFRNPWRMSFDRATGDLWVGDVGWELWEMVYRIRRGGNYGWSVMEGRQPVRPESRRGPTPILPPALDFPHTEAASITGGYVYRGSRYPDLVGCYICGDWVTRKIWATRFDGDRIVSHREIAQGAERIVSFCEDDAGELYILHYDDPGTLHELVPNEAARAGQPRFPRRLSETGLFTATAGHVPAPGVVPFAIQAEQWADHATSERLLALPGTSTVTLHEQPVPIPGGFFSGQVFLPKDGVLARTLALELERGNPRSRRRIETQLLHFDGQTWRGYSYQWNDAQTDAELVPAAGADRTFEVTDARAPGGKRKQTWHYPSRTECLLCHNPWAGFTLAFTQAQLDRDIPQGPSVVNQLEMFTRLGLVTLASKDRTGSRRAPARKPGRLVDPHDSTADLEARARSYLHVNCSHCHRFGAGGTANIDLRAELSLAETKALEVRPMQGTFEIHGAHILSPGDPYRSVLYYRMAKLGRGRMPHIGSEIVDERGLRLLHDWIRQLPVRSEELALLERLHRGDRPAEAIGRLLASTSGALRLAEAVGEGRLPEGVRTQAVQAAMARPEVQIRDLFERFVPDDQRVKRLGSVLRPEELLALQGDPARGRELFHKSAALSCVNCHRIGDVGSPLGPELTQIGKKYTRAQLLESILEPSKNVDPQYVSYLLETTDGQVHTGLLGSRSAVEVVLRTADGKEVRVPAGKVATLVPRKESLMPELLLRDLTAEQVADLLAYLASLQ